MVGICTISVSGLVIGNSRVRRLEAFNRLSREQVIRWRTNGEPIRLDRREPTVDLVPA